MTSSNFGHGKDEGDGKEGIQLQGEGVPSWTSN